ncbi:MAG: hypothetical protein QME66_06855 [Candidatus Eisenbacteria bacterium]|nr:hypothetical protein [Candidatus Eisenbacteria bacterium]
MKITHIFLLGLMLFMSLGAAAGYAGTQKYGEAISNRQVTPIKDILANPKAYEGKTVTIEGKIATECTSGCWFFVKLARGTASIYVDIGKSGFAIPQKRGKMVLVEGKVILGKSGPAILGKGVEIR